QWFRQEYCCSFEALEGLVYPDFARSVIDPAHIPPPEASGKLASIVGAMLSRLNLVETESPTKPGRESMPSGSHPIGRKVGGIDFGFRNPFAAVWGVLDRDGILWLTGEHYQTQRPLTYHAQHLPKDVRWYADPSGASDI